MLEMGLRGQGPHNNTQKVPQLLQQITAGSALRAGHGGSSAHCGAVHGAQHAARVARPPFPTAAKRVGAGIAYVAIAALLRLTHLFGCPRQQEVSCICSDSLGWAKLFTCCSRPCEPGARRNSLCYTQHCDLPGLQHQLHHIIMRLCFLRICFLDQGRRTASSSRSSSAAWRRL